jgi:hypothetical protein
MGHSATTILMLGLFHASSAFGAFEQVPESARKTLDDGKLVNTIRQVWQEFHDDYTIVSSRTDGRQKWAVLESYAKDFWAIQTALKVGENLQEYPGILAHGTTRWDAESRKYELILGLRPFNPRDGLGQYTVTFNVRGTITDIRVHKYKW